MIPLSVTRVYGLLLQEGIGEHTGMYRPWSVPFVTAAINFQFELIRDTCINSYYTQLNCVHISHVHTQPHTCTHTYKHTHTHTGTHMHARTHISYLLFIFVLWKRTLLFHWLMWIFFASYDFTHMSIYTLSSCLPTHTHVQSPFLLNSFFFLSSSWCISPSPRDLRLNNDQCRSCNQKHHKLLAYM